jgi:predicted transcriptional regulator
MKSGKKPNHIGSIDNDKDNCKSQILTVLKEKFNGISTTSELAEAVDLSWNTAEKYLLELTLDNKVIRMKKTGVNLWILKQVMNNNAGGEKG